jgi:tyrosyl-tRNA synthetase
VKRNLQGNAVSLNKEKVSDPAMMLNESHLLKGRYIVVQKGKKNYHLVIAG